MDRECLSIQLSILLFLLLLPDPFGVIGVLLHRRELVFCGDGKVLRQSPPIPPGRQLQLVADSLSVLDFPVENEEDNPTEQYNWHQYTHYNGDWNLLIRGRHVYVIV